MKYLLPIITAAVCFLYCSKESLQESLTGCDIEEGSLPCFNLKTSCYGGGYSEWADAEAQDGVRCQCCPKKE